MASTPDPFDAMIRAYYRRNAFVQFAVGFTIGSITAMILTLLVLALVSAP